MGPPRPKDDRSIYEMASSKSRRQIPGPEHEERYISRKTPALTI